MRIRPATLPKLFLCLVLASPSPIEADEPVSYNRDIRPILSDTCFRCHGPDAAKRLPKDDPLRLDKSGAATANRDGVPAIVPGKPDESEVVARIFSSDEEEVMPPSDSHLTLTEAQKNIIRQWIAEGAKYEAHWSFVPPKRQSRPSIKDTNWPVNPIDFFVLRHLEKRNLRPSSRADRTTLIRRATLALTGLLPPPLEVDAFLADSSANAYRKLLDRLLSSPAYGEHMAIIWLEAARYADTDGYQTDGERTMWPWRDWVIKAFNENMPYDQFSIRQLAGDMIPDETNQNRLASAFNRNHRLNNEGGALPEEFIVEYAIDRLETTSTIWLGLTAGCARCHDHKYDPLSQKEFYQLYAYFNSIGERGKAAGKNAPPIIQIGSPLVEMDDKAIARKRTELEKARRTSSQRQLSWEKTALKNFTSKGLDRWQLGRKVRAGKPSSGRLAAQADGSFLLKDNAPNNVTCQIEFSAPSGLKNLGALRIEALRDPSFTAPLKFARSVNGNFVLSEVELHLVNGGTGQVTKIPLHKVRANHHQKDYPPAGLIDGNSKTGWGIHGYNDTKNPLHAVLEPAKPVPLKGNSRLRVVLKTESGHAHHVMGKFRVSVSNETIPDGRTAPTDMSLLTALKKPRPQRTGEERKTISNHFSLHDPELSRLRSELAQLKKKSDKVSVPVLVMAELDKQTPTYRLERGVYTQPDKSELLTRRLPVSIAGSNQPKNRLELARWLLSKKNPLAARVFVNLIWQQHFGVGLVKTTEDFGLQGELPSHPDLLDWLAVDFMDSGWNIKRLHQQILSSATWTQSSSGTQETFLRDKENRLLARGPRFRLSGYAIRDSALNSSGLLVKELGGPPVKPYQPEGLWNAVSSGAGTRYPQGRGRALYRRSLYTYWKRAVNPPRQIIFDASSRESCNVRRRATNTALQALVLMNDVTFLEAARTLGALMMKEGGKTVDEKIDFGYRRAVGSKPAAEDLATLRKAYREFLADFQNDLAAAKELISHGESSTENSLDPAQLAAWTAVAHLAYNLDRTITLE